MKQLVDTCRCSLRVSVSRSWPVLQLSLLQLQMQTSATNSGHGGAFLAQCWCRCAVKSADSQHKMQRLNQVSMLACNL